MHKIRTFVLGNLPHVMVLIYLLLENAVVFIWGTKAPVLDLILYNALDIGYFYLIIYFILDKVNTNIRYDFVKLIFCLLVILVYSILVFTLVIVMTNYRGMPIPEDELLKSFFRTFFRRSTIFLFALGFWHFRQSKKKQLRILEHERESQNKREQELRMEAALLRAQLKPHMLINSLSGIQSVLIEKAPEASQILLLLSGILKTNITNSTTDGLITLQEEIMTVRRIVELNNLLGKSARLEIDTLTEEIYTKSFPPNILVTLVENLFKYGNFSNTANLPSITIQQDKQAMIYASTNKTAAVSKGMGMGLANIKAQLELHFTDHYRLQIDHGIDAYTVRLTIDFSQIP